MKIYFDQYVRNALYDKGGYYHDHSSVKEKRDFSRTHKYAHHKATRQFSYIGIC